MAALELRYSEVTRTDDGRVEMRLFIENRKSALVIRANKEAAHRLCLAIDGVVLQLRTVK